MAPSPPRSAKGLQARLTAKVGPLPVWAWAAVILGSYLLYTRLHRTAATATPVPAAATAGTAQQPASGQGNPADNMNSDLLAALLGNQQASQDAILAAIQSTTAEGAAGPQGPAGPTGATGAVGPAGAPGNNAPPSSASPVGAAAAPQLPAPDAPGAPGTASYIAATTGTPIVFTGSDSVPLIGIDARMAHASPAELARGAKIATGQAETYAKQVTAAAQGYHTAGF